MNVQVLPKKRHLLDADKQNFLTTKYIQMFKRITSAAFLAILMLCAVFCQAQHKKDTVRVVMLVSDTLHYTNYSPQLNNGNYFDKSGAVSWVTGYSVRELHNTSEGVIDPGGCMGCNWYDYWNDLGIYLDDNKKPLSKYIIVWQVVSAK